jgi:D-tyrosyl-tRNA(Tyr) deacylase
MRAVIQRVKSGSVEIEGEAIAAIGPGMVVLLGVSVNDTDKDAVWMANKTANLRIFEDSEGKMNRGIIETGGEALVISQFTLYGDARKGRRPSFIEAAPPDQADRLYERYVEELRAAGLSVHTGRFRATMLVSIENDGPVTIILDSGNEF